MITEVEQVSERLAGTDEPGVRGRRLCAKIVPLARSLRQGSALSDLDGRSLIYQISTSERLHAILHDMQDTVRRYQYERTNLQLQKHLCHLHSYAKRYRAMLAEQTRLRLDLQTNTRAIQEL